MTTLCQRFAANPLLRPADVPPSRPDFEVTCLLNPGAFRYRGRTGLLLRVAERPRPEAGWLATPICDPQTGELRVLRVRADDPELDAKDPRVFSYRGRCYLTSLSHLRLAWSDDGRVFKVEPQPTLAGLGPLETFGVEDCRVVELDGCYYLTYTAVSECGVGVSLASTTDWRTFTRHGMILPPHNKDCAIFPRRVGGDYVCFHRPSGLGLGGNFIWLSRSPDLRHWGQHTCLAMTRPGAWDCERIGAGAAPIETSAGWLAIYHGADARTCYRLGLLLLDRDHPERVLVRGTAPLLEPREPCELEGFFGNVVFTNGHVVDGDRVTIYYGASDAVVCAAEASIPELLASL